MFLVADAIKENHLAVSPETRLIEIINLTEKLKQEKRLAQELFVIENSQLLGIFTFSDLIHLITSGRNLEQVKVSEVMKPAITLEPDRDYQTALSLMREHDLKSLPIINKMAEFIEVVTPEIIAAKLQTELLSTKKQLQEEVQKYNYLKKEFDNLKNTNKLLQRKMCDSLATEAQLLQTTSELQELFQAFPDIYFRLKSDGTILSCHANEFSDLYLPPDKFLGKQLEEVVPPSIACQFQEAISQVLETNSLIAIEYSLSVPSGDKSFEARLQSTIGHDII
ncbi:MAG: CBS domain-containing protein, partial [Rivularia sp. (in: cyanobacteria)]